MGFFGSKYAMALWEAIDVLYPQKIQDDLMQWFTLGDDIISILMQGVQRLGQKLRIHTRKLIFQIYLIYFSCHFG